MSAFQVHIDTGELTHQISGPETGPVWMTLDGIPFPESRWDDFPTILIPQWVNDVLPLAGREGHADLHFMDGPFVLRVHMRPGRADLVGLRDRKPMRGVPSIQVDANSLFVALDDPLAKIVDWPGLDSEARKRLKNLRRKLAPLILGAS